MRLLFDKLAIFLSAVCIAHCLAVPLLILFMPATLTDAAHSDSTHYVLFVAALPLSIFGMWYGYRAHKKARYAALAILGLAGLAAGLALHGLIYEVYVSVLGALILAGAHLGNRAATQTAASA